MFLKIGINFKIAIFFSLLLLTSTYTILPSFAQYNSFDWSEICKKVELALYQPCDRYVNHYGELTFEGERAMTCIRNGLLLGGAALLLYNLPPALIIPGLDILSGMTACDRIVKLNLTSGFDNKDELVTNL